MLMPDHDVSRRDTSLKKGYALAQLPLGYRRHRSWVHQALELRVAETREERAEAADIIKRRHYAARWPCPPKTLMLTYLADLGTGCTAGLVTLALLPGQYHVTKACDLRQYEVLTLVRMWRADDLGPDVTPDFTPELLRRVIRRVRGDWCARKLRADGLRAEPRAVVTYADPALGHDGATYRAAGAVYCGPGAGGKHLFAWGLDPEIKAKLKQLQLAVEERNG